MSDDDWDALDAMEALAGGKHEHAVEADRYDEAAWKEALGLGGGLRAMWLRYTRTEDYADQFMNDVFQLLVQGDPVVRKRAEMGPEFVPNREMVEAFSKYPEVQNLRAHTANELVASSMAMLSMDTEIGQAFDRMRHARELAKQVQALMDQLKEMAQDIAEAAERGEDTSGAEAAFNAMMQQALSGQEAADAAAMAAALMAGVAMRNAARNAAAEIEAEKAMADAFGYSPGALRRMDFAERRALMQRLHRNRIAKFADLIGAFRAFAQAQWRKHVAGIPSEVAGVELTDDLTRLTPGELLNLAHPLLATDFYRRYADHELLTWQVRGREQQGKGPMIVVCDESGSMQMQDVGGVTREAWSKALTLALADIARKQKRPMLYVGFSSPGQLWVCDLTTPNPDVVIEMTEHFFGGGTHYEGPLKYALAQAETFSHLGRADIVFISDDQYTDVGSHFLGEWRQRREEVAIGCHGILIGAQHSGAMADLCDSLRPIDGIIGGGEIDAVADLFPQVIT